MGSGLSRFVGCFSRTGSEYPYGGSGVQFSEPLDEGLGHSFCYVRPPPLGSPTLVTPDKSEELKSGGKQGHVAPGVDEALVDTADLFSSTKEEKEISQMERGRSPSVERPRHLFEKPKVVSKTFCETSFKAISGASVSANTATPRSVTSYEQFNSFSNVIYDRAAAFESTSSFAAVPLQPIPRGFSGPLSGPLDRGVDKGFMSGPLERGFMSGPLERGFMSGPLERGFMSGPLDSSGDRPHFSAPLNGRYYESGYWKRKKSFARFMTNVGRPMKNAFARTASTIAKKHKTLVIPVMNYMTREVTRYNNSTGNTSAADQERRGPGPRRRGIDSNDPSIEFSSELDVKDSDNLQWAQGKAGEDRVHVVVSEEQGWIFVGIYDGFNGPDAPDFLMSNLYPAVSQELRGLLRDPQGMQPPGASVHNGNDIEEDFVEPEAEGDRHVGGEKHARSEIGCGRRTQRARGDMIEMSDIHHGGLGVVVVAQELRRRGDELGTSGSKSHADVGGPHECNVPAQSLCEGGRDRDGNETPDPEEEISNSIDDGLKSGLHKDRDEAVPFGDTEGEHGNQDSAVDPEGTVDDSLVTVEGGEIESERHSDRPEVLQTSAFSCRDHKRKKKRVRPGLKFRQGADRRKEQKQKYCQWNYDLEQENPGVLQKVKNAKVSQDPDNLHKNTGADHANVLQALARALKATENAYLDMADKVLFDNPELALMGSCVLVMLMKDEDVYILNVGDSRAILAQHPKEEPVNTGLGSGGRNGRNGNEAGTRHCLLRQELERIIEETPMELEALDAAHENGTVGGESPEETSILGALQLTKDHSTNIKEEVSRLRAEHPDEDIIENDRVKGKLKVTRAFGAGYLKQPKWNDALLEMFQIKFIGTAPYMTCSPALYHHRLGPRDEFLILSSDGLYQFFSNDEVVSHVENFMKSFPDGDPAQHLIEELLFRAAKKAGMDFHELLDIPQGDRRKYHDDVSVMVISLEGRIWRSSG